MSIGKAWSESELPINTVINPEVEDIVKAMLGIMTKSTSKSILVSGAKGVGKSLVINLLAKELKGRNWEILISSANDLMAGQRYIGDLEKNIFNLLEFLEQYSNSLCIVPRFHELYYGGRHEHSPTGILDQLLPSIESGKIRIIGEVDSDNLEKIIQFRPQILSAFEIIRIAPSSKEFTLDLASDWIKLDNNSVLWKETGPAELEEIYYLTKQYLSHKENPGTLIDLLKQTKKSSESALKRMGPIKVHDFIKSLSNITGLPTTILDDRESLDLEGLRNYFLSKVIGQEDAVNTLLERIAMIKAGLTDASRPSGVFLFVGPTGTGKTEIAKALAEYLFGSEDRLIRLDMSEYQTQESTFKILGETSDTADSSALVNRIRANPFSVVLLDEFEKAHPKIWDLFLQVFDDGRLTDQRGGMADFRHCIIIMTSNLGATLSSGNRIGFNRHDPVEVDANVMKSVNNTFRPEFVNRLDKIVVFNPLSKTVAKQILKRELKKILMRRGVRQRKWELELEDSATDFLLDNGFSSQLGARPLKRAIEKYLLAPLAITIVNHSFPKGDQFLLVSGGKTKLNVEFIDPNEPDYTWDQKKQIQDDQEHKSEGLSIKDVYFESKGILSEFLVIDKSLSELEQDVERLVLEDRKNTLMASMGQPEFWESEQRFAILSEIELLDRFFDTFESTRQLFERLRDPDKKRISYDARLIKKLSGRLYLLGNALNSYEQGIEQDAIMGIKYPVHSQLFGEKLNLMYENWAKSRNMERREIFNKQHNDEVEICYTFSGFGAYNILKNDSGAHIFEISGSNATKTEKHKVTVGIVPMLLEDYQNPKLDEFQKRLDNQASRQVCRRYRLSKSSLIKDLINNWQTGKVDRVFQGDFDLFN